LRPHKICEILEHAGREAEMRQIGREKAEFLRQPQTDAPKKS
jgi:hypothetical protein